MRFHPKKRRAVHSSDIGRTISLRLPQHLLDSIKAAASSRDVPYQSLLKVFLAERLTRERQERSG